MLPPISKAESNIVKNRITALADLLSTKPPLTRDITIPSSSRTTTIVTRAHLPPERWERNRSNILAPFPFKGRLGRDVADTPIVHIDLLGQSVRGETFSAFDDENVPGKRLLDMYPSRVKYETKGPRKPDKRTATGYEQDDWQEWLAKTLLPGIEEATGREDTLAVFSDGSVLKSTGNGQRNACKSGAAWKVWHSHSRVGAGRIGTGQCHSFDAEMIALHHGLKDAVGFAMEHANITHIVLYADNRGALQRILDPKCNEGQMWALGAIKFARQYLASDAQRKITVRWCPGHRGIRQNEDVDVEAKVAADGPQPDFVSMAHAKSSIRDTKLTGWRSMFHDKEYVGHQFLLKSDEFTKISDRVKSHAFIPNRNPYSKGGDALPRPRRRKKASKADESAAESDKPPRVDPDVEDHQTKFVTRLCRFYSGHFPHGEFRSRFNRDGRIACWCGNAPVETRDHIMFECPLWWRPWNPGIPHDDPPGGALIGKTKEEKMPDLDEVKRFLRANPLLGTFEWSDLVERAERDQNAGAPESYACWRVKLETTLRQTAWELWREQDIPSEGEPRETSFRRVWHPHYLALHMSGVERQEIAGPAPPEPRPGLGQLRETAWQRPVKKFLLHPFVKAFLDGPGNAPRRLAFQRKYVEDELQEREDAILDGADPASLPDMTALTAAWFHEERVRLHNPMEGLGEPYIAQFLTS